ncbi:unnamed protein product [Didymodactylos carnosus]|uniref:Uncharacterized protein n=2 Tax=Didymodactylos carnosus TaxID=1234261 RepID=A0A813QG25_9BILA|nr:unnamed protein product [Didymodactylos carnosus]CAF3548488.1 unnamed protein product [Didymodactylos carnosus]
MECLYLRDQLNKNQSLFERSLDDTRLKQVEQERSELQRNLVHTANHYDQISSEKRGLTLALEELRNKFDIEKQNLLDELTMLKRAKETFENDKRLREHELREIRDRTRTSADELNSAQAKVRLLEQQLEQSLNQNKDLSDELRHVKFESNDLQRSINELQLADREKERLQGIVAELEASRETNNLRQQLKTQDSRYNEAHFLRNKLAEEKGTLMKEMTRLETLTKELQREMEQLRLSARDRTDALQAKDKEILSLRKKEQNFRNAIENMQIKLDTESTKGKDMDGQLKQVQRQLNIEIQNANTTKREMNDLELKNVRLQDELNILQRDKDNLTSYIDSLQQRLTTEEDSSLSLRSQLQELEARLKEIDRLKSMEDLIQSQRWDDMSQLAETMKTVSHTMARATSPPRTRKRLELQ